MWYPTHFAKNAEWMRHPAFVELADGHPGADLPTANEGGQNDVGKYVWNVQAISICVRRGESALESVHFDKTKDNSREIG